MKNFLLDKHTMSIMTDLEFSVLGPTEKKYNTLLWAKSSYGLLEADVSTDLEDII